MASIHWLTIQKQELIPIALSAHAKIDLITTSTVLSTLQTNGLLKRQEHETDARAKTVELTETGIKNIKKQSRQRNCLTKNFSLHLKSA